jgi:flavin reductase (DIM6/NTAB) family NADH-FMN oxidoreductase RutF
MPPETTTSRRPSRSGRGRCVVDVDVFRDAMRYVPMPVAVITTLVGDAPHGTTVSAFGSLSLEPPMIYAALDVRSDLLELVRRTRRFGVNVLAASQRDLALAFARKGVDKFDGVEWRIEDGLPRLPSTATWIACDVDRLFARGDHVVALGTVVGVEPSALAPLVYYDRHFGTYLEAADAKAGAK